jgi:hypothetical protein
MEQNWQYVQERMNLIQQMNNGVKDQSQKNKAPPNYNQFTSMNNPYSITPPGVTIPEVGSNQLPIQMIPLDQHQKRQLPPGEEVSKMMMNPQNLEFKQPVVYDETGVCTGDSCSIKPVLKITWVDNNNQVSLIS